MPKQLWRASINTSIKHSLNNPAEHLTSCDDGKTRATSFTISLQPPYTMENQILDSDLYQDELKFTQASKGKRFANFAIDYIIAIFLIVVLFVIADFLHLNFVSTGLISNLFSLFLFALYYIICEGSLKGKTLGKVITKTRAINKDGSRMDMNTVVKRSFSRVVPFEQFSFFGNEPTGWHDRWSDTMVIDEAKSPQQINY